MVGGHARNAEARLWRFGLPILHKPKQRSHGSQSSVLEEFMRPSPILLARLLESDKKTYDSTETELNWPNHRVEILRLERPPALPNLYPSVGLISSCVTTRLPRLSVMTINGQSIYRQHVLHHSHDRLLGRHSGCQHHLQVVREVRRSLVHLLHGG